MAIESYPFEGAPTTEAQYALLAREWQDSGVVDTYGGPSLQVTADSSGMRVFVAAGRAIVRGVMVVSTGTEQLDITPADSQLPRIDAVVAHLDLTANLINLRVLAGTPAAVPVRPPLAATDDADYDLLLADVAVAAGAVTIAAQDVTDRRTYVGSRTGVWSTATRPVNPRRGQIGLNVTTGRLEYYDGSAWVPLVPSTVANSERWNGYTLTVSTTPPGAPTTDRIWINPIG